MGRGCAIDRDKHDASGLCAVSAGINRDLRNIARSRRYRGIAEVRTRSIKTTECTEARHRIIKISIRWPQVRGKQSLNAEYAEHIGLRHRSRNVVPTAAFILCNRKFHPGILRGDLRLQPGDNAHRSHPKFVVYPWIAVVRIMKARVP